MPTSNPLRPQAQPRAGLVLSWLLDLVFPPRCFICGRVDATWCAGCQQTLAQLPLRPQSRPTTPPLHGLLATAPHSGLLQTYVQQLKYEQATQLAVPLGRRLAHCIHRADVTFDTVIAVPLHVHRERERGYNQSKLLAQVVAKLLGKTDSSAQVVRSQDTRPQVGLNRAQRQVNVDGAFRASTSLQGQRVVLIDDVYTTGATLQACANALAAVGVASVYGLTVTAAA